MSSLRILLCEALVVFSFLVWCWSEPIQKRQTLWRESADRVDDRFRSGSVTADGKFAGTIKHHRVFVGVLAGPGETQRRNRFRKLCGPSLKKAVGEGLLKWRFFVGEPEDKSDVNFFWGHHQGVKFSKFSREASMSILAEQQEHKDLYIGSYGDHYTTCTRKVIDILRVGSMKGLELALELNERTVAGSDSAWGADFVVKHDIDRCFDYDVFAVGVQRYKRDYLGLGISQKEEEYANGPSMLNVAAIYRPLATKEDRAHVIEQENLNKQQKKWEAFINPFYSGFSRFSLVNMTHEGKLSFYANNTRIREGRTVSGVLPVFADWWISPAYASQRGVDGHFEPYPVGACYVMVQELASLLTHGGERDHVVLVGELQGSSSEDMNVGYWLGGVAERLRLQVDLVALNMCKHLTEPGTGVSDTNVNPNNVNHSKSA